MPIPGDPYWESVSLLLHADATIGTGNTLDVSPTPKSVVAVGGVTISATRAMFGPASVYSASSGNYFQIENGMGGTLGAVDFTIEGWVYNQNGNSTSTFLDINNPAAVYGGIHFTPAGIYASYSGGNWEIAPQGGTALGASWNHFALTRLGPDLSLWINGSRAAQYSIGTNAFAVGSGGANGRVYVGSASNSGTFYVDEVRITRGVARYTGPFTPEGPFPDASSVANPNTSLFTVEAVAEDTGFVIPGDGRARALAKTVLLGTTVQARSFALEVVSKDISFVMPGDLRARAMMKEVLLGTTTTVNSMLLEAVASANAQVPADTLARSVAKSVILATNPIISGTALEAVVADTSFVRPGDLKGRSMAKAVLIAPPLEAQVSSYVVEAIGYEYSPTDSNSYTLEVVSGLPYSVDLSNFTVEAVAESTITPPRPQTYGVWFTITEP